jgi:hypothetical protein
MDRAKDARLEQFRQFVEEHEPGAQIVHLYGACYWQNRYASPTVSAMRAFWRQEMEQIANALGYHGPVSGYDLSHSGDGWLARASSHSAAAFPTYVEYRPRLGSTECDIYYKTMQKMTTTTGDVGDRPLQYIVPTRSGSDPYTRRAPNRGLGITNASVVVTSNNKGQIHQVPADRIQSFDV